MKILLTGGGAPGAAGVIECLTRSKAVELWICDANPEASGKHILNRFFTIPKASDKNFIPSIIRSCKKRGITILMPLVTRELLVFASNRAKLEKAGIRLVSSSLQALEIANNKVALYQFLKARNILVPQFEVANNYKEFERAVKKLGYPGKRVTFKPAVSNGSRGFRIIDDKVDKGHLLWNEKPNNTLITFKEISAILKKQPVKDLLISEYLPGDEYSVDCLANNGKCLLALPRLRSKILNGISVAGEFVNDKEIISYCKHIIEAIGLHGNVGIQVKKATDGKYKILEINPRLQGTIVTNLAAGANLPLLAAEQQAGKKIDLKKIKIKWGLKFVRVWKEIYY